MYGGYLVIETNSAHPELVRIIETASVPHPPLPGHGKGPRMRYATRFDDLSAGHMHAHTALRHSLLNVDEGLYRSDPITAVAAVEAIELTHRRIYLDPVLAEDPTLAAAIASMHGKHRLSDRVWNAVGVIAALFLLIKLLLGF